MSGVFGQAASEADARVVRVKERGNENALMGGVVAACSESVIMGDVDDSFDFTNLMPFIDEPRRGADPVIGHWSKGGIEPGR